MIGRLHVNKSGGNVVNGIIEKYLADNETVEANTFVRFTNSINSIKEVNYDNLFVRGMLTISDNIFVMACCIGSTGNLKIALCEFENGGVTIINMLSPYGTSSDSARNVKMFMLNEENFVVFHTTSGGSAEYTARIFGININDLSIDEIQQLGISNTSAPHTVFRINETDFFILHSANRLYGTKCKIENNVITKETRTLINSDSGNISDKTLNISANNFITLRETYYSALSSYDLDYDIFKIENGNITKLASGNLMAYYAHNNFNSIYDIQKISENKVIVLTQSKTDEYSQSRSLSIRYFNVSNFENNKAFLLSESIICYDTIQKYVTNGHMIYSANIIIRDNNHFDILYINTIRNDYTSLDLYLLKYKIEDNNIILQDTKKILSNINEIINLPFIDGYPSFAKYDKGETKSSIVTYESKIKKSTGIIDGLTKSKCTTTQKGDVWLNNTGEEN